jgi:hypothetical protein
VRRKNGGFRFRDIKLGKEPGYLINGLIPREGLIVVWGPPKCGKTFWVFDLMMHVAPGYIAAGRGHWCAADRQ